MQRTIKPSKITALANLKLGQLFLDLRCEVEQVQNLRKLRPGHLTNPREFCLIGYQAVKIKPQPIDHRYCL
jgi:hypothetical protein